MRAQILLDFEAEINFMNAKIQKVLRFIMHVLFQKIFISFQIDHALNLIEVCFHVEMKIEDFSIYHYIFVMNSFNHFLIFDQFFLAAVSIDYSYKKNDIYAICINPKRICSTVFKVMNRYDRQNKDRFFMYEYSIILKTNATIF